MDEELFAYMLLVFVFLIGAGFSFGITNQIYKNGISTSEPFVVNKNIYSCTKKEIK